MRQRRDELANANSHARQHGRRNAVPSDDAGFARGAGLAVVTLPLAPVSRSKAAPYGRASQRWPCLRKCVAASLRRLFRCAMVGRVGVEPTTSRLSGVRSNHLSYRPIAPATGKACGAREPAQAGFSNLMKGHEDGG